jgi:NADPH2:quinone reductase
MKAWVCTALSGLDSLGYMEVDEPVPGPGEILVETRAYGLNFADALKTRGQYQLKQRPPFILGSEFSGICRAVGEGVGHLRPGDRVSGMKDQGAFADLAVAPALRCIRIPDAMDFETAAGIYSGYMTAWYGLVNRGRLNKGEQVLVLAAGGGTGLAAVNIAAALGARVTAVAGSEEKLGVARDKGARHCLNYREVDLEKELRALTDNEGFDLVFDPVGGDLFDCCSRRVAWNGRYLVVGFAAGRIPRLPVNLALVKGYSLVGVFADDFISREPENFQATIDALHQLYLEGRLAPHVQCPGSIEELPAVLANLEAGQVVGKWVLSR